MPDTAVRIRSADVGTVRCASHNHTLRDPARGGSTMPLYMDKHNMGEGVSIEDVAQAHQADLQTQGKHDVNYLRYWVDEKQGQSSAWSRRRPRRLRQRCTGRRTAWSRTRF